MQPHDLIPVYVASDPIKADIIKNMLEDEDIRAFVDGENQGAFEGTLMIPVKVLVADAQAAEARRLIAEHEALVLAHDAKSNESAAEENESPSNA